MRFFALFVLVFISTAAALAGPFVLPPNRLADIPTSGKYEFMGFGVSLLNELGRYLETRRGKAPTAYSRKTFHIMLTDKITNRSQAQRLATLVYFIETNTDQIDFESLSKWLDIEVQICLDATDLQKNALAELDGVTHELSGKSDGFAWASQARVIFLKMIPKIDNKDRLESFRKVLDVGREAFAPFGIDFQRVPISSLTPNQRDNYYFAADLVESYHDGNEKIYSSSFVKACGRRLSHLFDFLNPWK